LRTSRTRLFEMGLSGKFCLCGLALAAPVCRLLKNSEKCVIALIILFSV
jgi:hypothetical protein